MLKPAGFSDTKAASYGVSRPILPHLVFNLGSQKVVKIFTSNFVDFSNSPEPALSSWLSYLHHHATNQRRELEEAVIFGQNADGRFWIYRWDFVAIAILVVKKFPFYFKVLQTIQAPAKQFQQILIKHSYVLYLVIITAIEQLITAINRPCRFPASIEWFLNFFKCVYPLWFWQKLIQYVVRIIGLHRHNVSKMRERLEICLTNLQSNSTGNNTNHECSKP